MADTTEGAWKEIESNLRLIENNHRADVYVSSIRMAIAAIRAAGATDDCADRLADAEAQLARWPDETTIYNDAYGVGFREGREKERAAGATERERAIEDAARAVLVAEAETPGFYEPLNAAIRALRVALDQMFEDLVVRPLATLASAPVQTGTGGIDTERLHTAIETYLDNEDFGFVGSRIRAGRIAEIYKNL